MGSVESPDLIVGLRIGAILFAAISIRNALIQGGLILRLTAAILSNRTRLPGPFTRFANRGEIQQAMVLGRMPPRLYSRYLGNALMIVLSAGLILYMAVFLATRIPEKKALSGMMVMMVITVLAHFTASRRAGRYDAEVEWALGRSPETPMTTNEAEPEVRGAYATARVAIRRIWTQVWLVALSGAFIWMVFQNQEGARIKRAMARPEEGQMTRLHPQAVIGEKRAFYFKDAGGSVAKLEKPRIYSGSTLAVYTTDDGEPVLALLLKKRSVESWAAKKSLPAILYAPLITLAYPELRRDRPKVIAVIGEPEDLTSFAKGRRALGPIFSVVYVGFSIYALFLITSLRRLVRVTFARRGRMRV